MIMMIRALISLQLLSVCCLLTSERLQGGESADQLQVFPAAVSLTSGRDIQRVIVLRRQPDGSTEDVTAQATFTASDPQIFRVESGRIHPLADGGSRLQIRVGDSAAEIPVNIADSAVQPDLSFRSEVLATLTKAGCNSGKCHGAASGKDGFRLSLFGYDPAGDQYRLTREIPGRRVNVSAPDRSLLIQKALGNVDHTGGQCVQEDSPELQTLLSWIQTGAPADPDTAAVPLRLRVYPEEAIFPQKGGTQQLLVMAEFSDGTDRDVTDLAVFLSNNDAAAGVNAGGVVTANGSGSAFILARFDQFTEGTAIIVRPGTEYRFPEITPVNDVDRLVFARWQNLHLLPSEVCSDDVFLRRATIDLTGRLPSPEELRAFQADPAADKRSRMIDQLLESPDFTELWVMRWAELLQIRTSNGVSPKGLLLYDRWLRERVRAGVTIDKIVKELLPATGGTFENPATSYYQTETTPQLLAENVAQSFLGTRIQCAQCHNHPFDRWTMDDYYGFASFFSQVGYKQAQDPREIMIFNAAAGGLKHPVGDRDAVPTFLGAGTAVLPAGADYREILAAWLPTPANPAFGRNLANVVWSHFFGMGIVEPVDDVRVSNPPSNPALLQYLGEKLSRDGYDIKPLVREICNSRTWQLSTQRNDSNRLDERHFSHGKVRRMRAEVLLDCISQVTATADDFRGLPAGSRAIQIADGQTPNYFLSTFGRSTRATACSCEVKTSPTLSQALHLLNGETTSGKIAEGQLIERLLQQHDDPLIVVRELYVRCLSREPSQAELEKIQARLEEQGDLQQSLTDLFWALLNSNEFVFNH
ncbi:MAG: DUF1549 domain-containing protein [Planctomycetaceae bacterium]